MPFPYSFCKKFSLAIEKWNTSSEEKSGRVNFPIRHSRYILIPPLVAKYPHSWETKFTTRGFATRADFVTHLWGYFTTRGGIRMYLL